MKPLQIIASTALFLTPFTLQAFEDTSVYLATDVETSGGGMTWRDSVSGHNLLLTDPTGVSLGDRPTTGDDKKSVVFDGSQTMPFRTESGIPVPAAGLRVKLAFRPESGGGAEQSIMRQGNWELRYSADTQRIQFIVWHGDGDTYTNLHGSIEEGVWSEVEAIYENALIKLEVNGKEETRESRGDLSTRHAQAALFMGATSGTGIEIRPLRGALADIRIAID